MSYLVQRGDTISKVTQLLKTNWETLHRLNPQAVGRSNRTGNWFLKEGAVLKVQETFDAILHREGTEKASSALGKSKKSEPWIDYTIKSGDTLWALAVKRFHVNVEDVIKDNNIQDPRKLRPDQKIRIRVHPVPQNEQVVVASWYGKSYHGRPMANGQLFNMYSDTIAHKELPFGTRVELKNPETGKVEDAVVTDRGPYIEGRDVDLSYGLAKKLDLVKKGVGKLLMKVI